MVFWILGRLCQSNVHQCTDNSTPSCSPTRVCYVDKHLLARRENAGVSATQKNTPSCVEEESSKDFVSPLLSEAEQNFEHQKPNLLSITHGITALGETLVPRLKTSTPKLDTPMSSAVLTQDHITRINSSTERITNYSTVANRNYTAATPPSPPSPA